MANQLIGATMLCWNVSAVGKRGTVRVFAPNRYCAEREGSIKLGTYHWLCTARLVHGLQSLGLA
jgi:hypothetical protein